jgi:DNA polymerase-1
MSEFTAAIAAAVAGSPMSTGSVRIIPNRVLLVDGDGLAYYCAGRDGTSIGDARATLVEKVRRAQRACAAEHVLILVTASGSIKGHRYAVATVKPYQGQRSGSRRPDNWRGLRDFLESSDFPFKTEFTGTVEADDLFGIHSSTDPESFVIYTQDKDMRMLPGWHLDWADNTLLYVPSDCYSTERHGKTYGLKWFWLQMLHGDTADNIPGLPKYWAYSKDGAESLKPVGEVTANKLLADTLTGEEARRVVSLHYAGYYGKAWRTAMLEQAVLLWMRKGARGYWCDVMAKPNPLYFQDLDESVLWCDAFMEIQERIANADRLNSLNSDPAYEVAGAAPNPESSEVCAVQTASQAGGG